MCTVRPPPKDIDVENIVPVNKSVIANLKDEITRLQSQGSNIANLEEQVENFLVRCFSVQKLDIDVQKTFAYACDLKFIDVENICLCLRTTLKMSLKQHRQKTSTSKTFAYACDLKFIDV
ncbi:hypothetical protein L1887_03012 [Cichorium endivia]|nr:hypothetical protein L1887_03012 [Cichorium endivia]